MAMLMQHIYLSSVLRQKVPSPYYCKATFTTSTSNSYNLRKQLHFFFKLVHPDLCAEFPASARNTNIESLGTLNAYVDALEQPTSQLEQHSSSSDIPQTTLQFFKPYVTNNGRVLSHRVTPLNIILPSLRREATFLEKLAISKLMIKSIDSEINANHSIHRQISDVPSLASLFTEKNSTRNAFNELWKENIQEELMASSLFPYLGDPEALAIEELQTKRKELFNLIVSQRWKYTTRGSNKSKTRQRVKVLYKNVKKKVNRILGDSPLPGTDQDISERLIVKKHCEELRAHALGAHPCLTYVHTNLTSKEQIEAKNRILGRNLIKDSDVWLLRNMFKLLTKGIIPIPVLLTSPTLLLSSIQQSEDSKYNSTLFKWLEKGYQIDQKRGFLKIPYNFNVWTLADFLEEYLDDLQIIRDMAMQKMRNRMTHDVNVMND